MLNSVNNLNWSRKKHVRKYTYSVQEIDVGRGREGVNKKNLYTLSQLFNNINQNM